MSSKASAPRRSGRAKQFVKDWKRLARSGRYPMQELKDVIQFLVENRGPLPPEFFDHPLKGAWMDHRDCHIRGDWVPVSALFENLESGATLDQFLAWFPGVARAQAEAVLEHAARSLQAA